MISELVFHPQRRLNNRIDGGKACLREVSGGEKNNSAIIGVGQKERGPLPPLHYGVKPS